MKPSATRLANDRPKRRQAVPILRLGSKANAKPDRHRIRASRVQQCGLPRPSGDKLGTASGGVGRMEYAIRGETMLSLKTWTARSGNRVIIVTAECVEVARQIVADRHGIELANVDLVPAVTRSRWSHVIEHDKAAIVAELRRLEAEWSARVAGDTEAGLHKAAAFCSGVSSGVSAAIKAVEAGGALLPEKNEKEVDS
jgi:hypothetical protein